MVWKHVGDVGTTSIDVDQESCNIVISHNGKVFLFSVTHAANLAMLLDEAIATVKGEAIKQNPTGDWG